VDEQQGSIVYAEFMQMPEANELQVLSLLIQIAER
jgi:hypothetical protein